MSPLRPSYLTPTSIFLCGVLLFTAGCAPRHNSAVARTYLEAKAIDHRRAQEARVHAVGLRLLSAMPDPPNVAFVVDTDSQAINAYTTFGKVTITSTMVQFTRTDDELAVLLGHELAHHSQGHLGKQLMTNIFIATLAAAADAYAPGTGSGVQAVGHSLYNHYSQGQELTADAVGIEYAAAAEYDPRAGVTFFERLAIEVPLTLSAGFFDSHPSSPERFIAAQQRGNALVAQGYGAQSITPGVAVATATAPPAATVAPAAIAPVPQPLVVTPVTAVPVAPVAAPPVTAAPAPPVQTVIPASYPAPPSVPLRSASMDAPEPRLHGGHATTRRRTRVPGGENESGGVPGD